MEIIRLFGKNLRKHRLQKGYSQEKLAELCGLHRTYISDIECLQRNVSLVNIQKIADALEIKPFILLMEESDNGKERS